MKYTGEYTREISFPIGGIGTGCFGIAGNGSFVDFEIFNRPAKGRILEYAHLAVRAKYPDGKTVVKMLNGDLHKDLTGQYSKTTFAGFGFGPNNGTMSGLPHFRNCTFDGEFPIARLTFDDDDFPAKVIMTVFNPFIPLDSFNSSIPAGFFNLKFENTSKERIEYSAVFSMRNPFGETVNEIIERDGREYLKLTTPKDKESVEYGDLTVATDAKDSDIQKYWYRGGWFGFDHLDVYVNELRSGERLRKREYDDPGQSDLGSVSTYFALDVGESEDVRFVFSWNIPNNYNYWNSKKSDATWKNYYATVFESSVDSASYCLDNFDSLYLRTEKFKNILFSSTLDKTVTEAVSANLSVLKSATVLRLEDGSFYGWEGVHENEGSCEGTCQHVWNYAYALCFLFPDLERSIRDNEFKFCTEENGRTYFRMALPRESEKIHMRSCVDGQMGTVIKVFRDWKLTGDDDWLRKNWETVKSLISYAWSEENEDEWDRNRDGVLEGRQHHTLDQELFGPCGWLQGFYLGALKAGIEMAYYLGDREAYNEYSVLFKKGYDWTKNNLFNGEYFNQKVDLSNQQIIEHFGCGGYYWYGEAGELRYQIGNGCEIDQLCGQWHANICGLGQIFDSEQKKKALQSLYNYNFKANMREQFNTWRVYTLNDEGGAVMCSFPHDAPVIPLPYHSETMSGFEYALAGLMISEGMEAEGLEIIKAIRNRYDGKKRNPWSEIECGSNYARSMASFALLPIYSGLMFDMPKGILGFKPITYGDFSCLFSIGTAWGTLSKVSCRLRLEIAEGSLSLKGFYAGAEMKSVIADGKTLSFESNGEIARFDEVNIEDYIEVELDEIY